MYWALVKGGLNEIKIPGFTAVVSLYQTNGQYHPSRPLDLGGMVTHPALYLIDSPNINVSWEKGPGGLGTLTVTGENFAPGTEATLTVGNCDAFPLRTSVRATQRSEFCPDWRHCWLYPGGGFSTSIPCYCEGSASVEAVDELGNTAQGTAPIPC